MRSSKEYLPSDRLHNIGFLDNPKRFNVAITRACSLLIVVGNPHVLCRDPHWGDLLRYCKERDVYTGTEFLIPLESDDESDTSNNELAVEFDELLLDASQAVTQEGAPMPDYD